MRRIRVAGRLVVIAAIAVVLGHQLPADLDQTSGDLVWNIPMLEAGERLGPFAYRVTPAPGQDGAVIFRGVSVEPTLSTPDDVEVVSYPLRLNGLWGERGLRRTILPTGLTVFTVQRPDSETVSMRVGVRAGSRDEDEVTSGGSHWLEHGHFLGTTHRSAARIDEEAAGAGAHSNASTGWEATDFWYVVPLNRFAQALDLLSDQMVNSNFPQQEFDREKPVVFEELKMRDDTPSTRRADVKTARNYLVAALDEIAAGKPVTIAATRAYGCSIKYKTS